MAGRCGAEGVCCGGGTHILGQRVSSASGRWRCGLLRGTRGGRYLSGALHWQVDMSINPASLPHSPSSPIPFSSYFSNSLPVPFLSSYLSLPIFYTPLPLLPWLFLATHVLPFISPAFTTSLSSWFFSTSPSPSPFLALLSFPTTFSSLSGQDTEPPSISVPNYTVPNQPTPRPLPVPFRNNISARNDDRNQIPRHQRLLVKYISQSLVPGRRVLLSRALLVLSIALSLDVPLPSRLTSESKGREI